MRRYILYLASLIVVVLTCAPATFAGKGAIVSRTALYTPSPPQSLTLACDTSARLATIDYWPLATDARYIALFEAQGPGYVFLSTDTESRVSLTLPPTGPPQWYTLDLTPPKGSGGVIQLRMGVEAVSCAARGNSGVVIRSLNIFVTP